MEILKALRRWCAAHSRQELACLLALLVCVGGCMLVGRPVRGFAFGHAFHVDEQGLACINCHADAARLDSPGMPAPDTCGACHDELDEKKDPERRVATLFDGESFRALHAMRSSKELVFSHARHAGKLECARCHAQLATNEDVGELQPPTMDDCTQCHTHEGVAGDCATCHTSVRRELPPASHGANWTRFHGPVVRSFSDKTADRCELCHSESTCLRCHAQEPPANHTLQFRERGHGALAALDREGCATCHKSDGCERCHAEVQPRSHMGNFGGTFSAHCYGCHLPLRGEGCVACHKDTPSHRATPKPPDHTPVMVCRQCHGPFAPLPHADKGDDCNACHP